MSLHPIYKDCQVFINCCGKSGSSTLYKTFKKNNFNTLHTHGVKYFKGLVHKENLKSEVLKYNENFWDYIDDSCKKYKDIYIIDSIRLPLERSISSFFQGIEHFEWNYNSMDIKDIIDDYNLKWYMNESYYPFKDVCNKYNIELSFIHNNNNKKYYHEIIQKDETNIHFIILNYNEIVNGNYINILSKIIDSNLIPYSSNISKQKKYYECYKLFLKNYYITEDVKNYILNHDEYKIFLSLDEQNYYKEYLNSLIAKNKQ